MVIDTSIIIAILQDEPERTRYVELIGTSQSRLVSAASVLEAGIVMEDRLGVSGAAQLDRLLHALGVEIVAFDAAQAGVARMAFRSFGKGRHPAQLNVCDCMTYALAKVRGEPLLFKGDDFSLTDIVPADRPS